jgi:hypothetical protein
MKAGHSLYQTRTCVVCGKSTIVELDTVKAEKWLRGSGHVQDIFPEMSKDDRELLISGTHPVCWNKLFPPDESLE